MSRTAHDQAPARRSRRAFVVETTSLKRTNGARIAVERSGVIDDLAVSGSQVPAGEPVTIRAVLESVHEGILVSGTVSAPWVGLCRRCLEEARGELEVAIRELCVEDGDEETTYPLTATAVDLLPIVHDACILELPLAPLCREDCLGLCPECGANRNLEPCSCRPQLDSRWSGLAVLTGGRVEAAPDEKDRSSRIE